MAAKDAASLDRPCARRLRDLAVGTEECSRRGSNQRMAPQENKKTDNFKPVVLGEFQAGVDTCSAQPPAASSGGTTLISTREGIRTGAALDRSVRFA